MPISAALAAVAVADLDQAKAFYATLFGRAADIEPMPTLAQWDIDGGGSLQVVENPDVSGSSMATLLVTDFDSFRESLGNVGVDIGDTIDGVISRIFQLTDPAGNVITVAEVPPGP